MKSCFVLIVEDEALIAMHIKAILEDEGYCVFLVNNVDDAISCIQKESIALVLIDIHLNKDKDGVSLGKYLLQLDRIPYIYITSYIDKETLDRVKETRPYGYIVKPFKDIDVITSTSIVLNNYKYKEIDILRKKEVPNDFIPYRLKEVIAYINENIEQKLEIDELASKSQWKRHHFMKMFTKYVHVSPYQYILTRKIEKAKILLVDTAIPLNQIAYELGFKSYANFSNAFKKNCNMTAENYRKRFQKK